MVKSAQQIADRYNQSRQLKVNEDGSIDINSQADEISKYILQDVDEASSTITYLCKEKNDGTWLFVKIDSSSGVVFRYANISNNAAYTTYSTAYTGRASLTYVLLENLTGL